MNYPGFLRELNIYKRFNDDMSMKSYLENVLISNLRYEKFKRIESDKLIESAKADLNSKICEFCNAWCNPRNKKGLSKFSYKRQRDLIKFVKDFEKNITDTPQWARGDEFEQLSFFGNSYSMGAK